MSRHATTLREQSGGAMVPAVIDDRLPLDRLFEVETQWCVKRIQVLRELWSAGVSEADWPQSVHWNWAFKASALTASRFKASGDARLFGIEAQGQWQGILLGLSEDHFTRLDKKGRPLVYVDFIESAPWNWDAPASNRIGKYRGVGIQLMKLAVQWSLSLKYGGRVGLHSLPQSESFYSGRCRMKNFGPDAQYDGLCYFELSERDSHSFPRRTP